MRKRSNAAVVDEGNPFEDMPEAKPLKALEVSAEELFLQEPRQDFWKMYGNLRLHGGPTVEEMFEAFALRMKQ